MPDDASLNTANLLFWVTELQAGRPGAAEPQFKQILAKVDRLAADMFRKFPRVGRFVEVEDVVQNSLIRLLRAMREVRPASTRHFYALVNELIRRELLDLTKSLYGPRGAGTHLAPVPVGDADGEHAPAAPDAGELDRLTAFHEAVERLPVEQREVVGLTYYHAWPQAEIADLFGVSERTVQRWLKDATAALRGVVPGG